jgi:predicted NUDIX family phosphoesterase
MSKEDERVLVIGRRAVFPENSWDGINPDESDRIVSLASAVGKFRRRGKIEEDPSLKQIIPYVVFRHQNRYLLMQRRGSHSEQRLANLYSLGIGGHLCEEDLEQGEDILDWAKREFEEEVDYQGNLIFEVIGALNDDSDAVGRVHLGVVIVAEGDSPQIGVKDELKSGRLVTLSEALGQYDLMENWSRIVFKYLQMLEQNESPQTGAA